MFKDNLSLFLTILIVLVAMILVSSIAIIGIPILILWTSILCFYYPYAKLCKKFFRNTRLYSGCWRRLYNYCHLRSYLLKVCL